jgi:anti-sigma factor RsiW
MSVLVGLTVLHGTPWLASPASVMRTQTSWIEREIVTSHVRALISSRDIDVVSTDQHTVKPWFNGRINYAPPVVDPRAYGFPLIGGRLDYVDDRPVSVIVYRYLKHPIDLYVFPDTDDGSAASNAVVDTPKMMSKEGYSIISWKRNGMVFWAITDASMPNLTSFVSVVRGMT